MSRAAAFARACRVANRPRFRSVTGLGGPLERALAATGFVDPDGTDALGLRRPGVGPGPRLDAVFSDRAGVAADAVYETADGPKLIVKQVPANATADGTERLVQERVWNLGLAPLLWVVTPVEVRVHDAFRGVGKSDAQGPLKTYRLDVAAEMEALEAACGRFALDTGAFWSSGLGERLDRRGKVDRILLEEIRALEDRMVGVSCPDPTAGDEAAARSQCQEIITCTLFASYLIDRGIAQRLLPETIPPDLALVFADRGTTLDLFAWLHDTYNGDVFPDGVGSGLLDGHLDLLRMFAESTGLAERRAGQTTLFRFRFDVIPVELIGSVYEAFARRAAADMAKRLGLHYTPVELVHMALDPVFEGLDAHARILDPTCGSGLFLVQALRRLTWKRCGDGPRPRALIRDILYRQVFGIDIEPAALRVAAFSLYLAALELETEAASGESTRFERLIDLTLWPLDFLQSSTERFAASLGVDALVGNPPWTHGALKAAADRSGSSSSKVEIPEPDDRRHDIDDDLDDEEEFEGDPALQVPGTTEASRAEGARRAPDQRFLAAAMRIMGRSGRIALYLKASPFLSRSPEATAFRRHVIEGLEQLAVLNLSPLRIDKLFPEAKSPGILLCANCGNLPPPDAMLVGTFPWTPDFKRGGALALSAADVRVVQKTRIVAMPSVLKASLLGTPRDVSAIERMEREFGSLDDLLSASGVGLAQGFQVKSLGTAKTKPVSEEIALLPAIFPKEYEAVALDAQRHPSLRERGIKRLLRERDRKIYRAPLVLFPKSAHLKALQHGRTSAALVREDAAFSHGFYGLSFHEADPRLATVLCALLNSAVPGFLFLFGAGALGMERPSIELQDLRALRVPPLKVTDALTDRAVAALASAQTDGCAALDAFASRLYGLDPDERDLIADAVRRGRSTFLGTVASRVWDADRPAPAEMNRYAHAACGTVNAVLKVAGRRHLIASVARSSRQSDDPLDRFLAVRFAIANGPPTGDPVVELDEAETAKVFADLRGRLVRSPTPYLRERRSLRLYDGPMVTVVKPAQRRYWSVAAAMQDADIILADHAPGTA